MKKLFEDKALIKRWEDALPFSQWMPKGMELQYQMSKSEMATFINTIDQLWKPPHYNLCYGIDIEPHPDCVCCKWITLKRTMLGDN